MTPPLNPQTVRSLLSGCYPTKPAPSTNPKFAEWRRLRREANLANVAKGLTMTGQPRKRAPYSPWTSLAGMTEEQKQERRRLQTSRANRAARKAK